MKNIIFDVGSVLIGYRWRDMCLDEGWEEDKADKIGRGFFSNPLWPDYDAGLVSTDKLVESVAENYPELETDIRWFITSGKKMIVERPKIWELVKRLKEKGFGLYLLSNYSEELFTLHTAGLPFLELVNGGVISYQIHQIKPNPSIYQYLLDKYQLKPEDCLFFDDRPENTEAAKKLGMQAVTVEDGSEELLIRELEKLLQ
ncbi:MAG: HAD family phosphatase [Lachnospiraceae bacterium]|nr:HAD family phosphatase [Lachnospiraceae bacterium]